MHICTVATLCFPEKTFPRNYYYCVQDENSLCLCFKNMYRTLFVAIFTSTFIFSMYDHILVCLDAFSHTYRNINISNQFLAHSFISWSFFLHFGHFFHICFCFFINVWNLIESLGQGVLLIFGTLYFF